jgi:hypothetical protein
MPSTCTKAGMNMSDLGTLRHFKGLGGCCECLDRQRKRSGEVSFRFQMERNTLGVLSVPKDKNLMD